MCRKVVSGKYGIDVGISVHRGRDIMEEVMKEYEEGVVGPSKVHSALTRWW